MTRTGRRVREDGDGRARLLDAEILADQEEAGDRPAELAQREQRTELPLIRIRFCQDLVDRLDRLGGRLGVGKRIPRSALVRALLVISMTDERLELIEAALSADPIKRGVAKGPRKARPE